LLDTLLFAILVVFTYSVVGFVYGAFWFAVVLILGVFYFIIGFDTFFTSLTVFSSFFYPPICLSETLERRFLLTAEGLVGLVGFILGIRIKL
jgi:hypothetical protein